MSKVYAIYRLPSVQKDLRRLPSSVVRLIFAKIKQLALDPIPKGAEPIEGYKHHYRIRAGHYRVIYKVAKQIEIITIIKIGHRKDVYKKF